MKRTMIIITAPQTDLTSSSKVLTTTLNIHNPTGESNSPQSLRSRMYLGTAIPVGEDTGRNPETQRLINLCTTIAGLNQTTNRTGTCLPNNMLHFSITHSVNLLLSIFAGDIGGEVLGRMSKMRSFMVKK